MDSASHGPPVFRTTSWTNILSAAQPGSADGHEAFARLYQDYWRPLYAFVRRKGHAPQAAEDILQDFFHVLIERDRLAGLQRDGGRFRGFLLRSLQNFLTNAWDRQRAQKRGGGAEMVPLDAELAEQLYHADQPDQWTADRSFDRQWALATLDRAMSRLAAEARETGREALFAAIQPKLQGDTAGPAYAEIGRDRGMSEGAVKVSVHRFRTRYGELLREEIARTVESPEEVTQELRYLIGILGSDPSDPPS